jgi:hypothetical protein
MKIKKNDIIIFFFFICIFFWMTTIKSIIDKEGFNDVQYHDKAEDIEKNMTSGSWLLNKGKLEFMPSSKIASKFTYYDTGYYKYGGSTYIPSYLDSILFRK